MRTLLVIALLFVMGCIPTTQHINTLTDAVSQIVPAVREEVAKGNINIDKVLTRVETVNEAVKEKADESTVEQLTAANEASRPFNPYADEVNAVLGLVAVIGGIWAKGKIDEKNKINAKYQAHKAGTELVKLAHPDVAAELYKAIGDARNGKT